MVRSLKSPVAIAIGALALTYLVTVIVRWAALRPHVLLSAYDTSAVSFSPDGRLLATGHKVEVKNKAEGWIYGSGLLQMRQLPSAAITSTLPFTEAATRQQDIRKSTGGLGWIRFSSDGSLLMASNYVNDSIAVLDVTAGTWLFVRKGQWHPNRYINRPIGFTADGTRVLYLAVKPKKFKYDAQQQDVEKIRHEANLVTCEARTGNVVSQHSNVLAPGEWPMRLTLLPDGQSIACITKLGDDGLDYPTSGKLLIINARTGRRERVAQLGYMPIELASSPEGKTLAVLDGEGTAHLFDRTLHEYRQATGRSTPVRTVRMRTFPDGHWLAFSPDGGKLAGVSREYIAIWDARNPGASPRLLRKRGKWAWPQDLAFSPDGKILAVANGEKSVALYPIPETGK